MGRERGGKDRRGVRTEPSRISRACVRGGGAGAVRGATAQVEEFRAAVRTVRGSAGRVDGVAAPMAVLVQPMLRARVGGMLFGADPVAGRTDRMVVSAVRGGRDSLVSGEQPGTSYWLTGWGRLLRTEAAEAGSGAEPTELPDAQRSTEGARRSVHDART